MPVGAVLVADGKVVARARNCVELFGDPTAHAELLVIQQARRLRVYCNKLLALCLLQRPVSLTTRRPSSPSPNCWPS